MSRPEQDPTTPDREDMRSYVRGLPEDRQRLFCTWAIAQRIIHVGTDFFGNRLNERERRVWRRIVEETEKTMIKQYSLQGKGKLGNFFEEHHMKDMVYRSVFEEEYYHLESQS